MLKEMEGFHPAFLKVAEMANDVLPLWRCATREPLPTLSKGRMVVIGDAAHPVMPHLGMGAVSAIEDAGALKVLFSNLPESGEIAPLVEQRLALFSKLRVGRVAAYKYWSDVPHFGNAVEEQRERVEQFVDPADLPGM